MIDTMVTSLPIPLNCDSKVKDHFVDEISDVLSGIKEFISLMSSYLVFEGNVICLVFYCR